MKNKSWPKYGIYIILFSLLLFLKEYMIGRLQFAFNRSWGSTVSYYLIITLPLIFNLFIGILLGSDHFIGELKKDGTWKINVPKIVLIGLPSLFFSLTYHFACINSPFVNSMMSILTSFGTNFVSVFQIVLGNALITCLYKHCQKE